MKGGSLPVVWQMPLSILLRGLSVSWPHDWRISVRLWMRHYEQAGAQQIGEPVGLELAKAFMILKLEK
jgi:hypothetical protein